LTILETACGPCHIPGMTKKPKRPRDVNQLAKMMVDIASGETNEKVAVKRPPVKRKPKKSIS
jgi:hypothetical protein